MTEDTEPTFDSSGPGGKPLPEPAEADDEKPETSDDATADDAAEPEADEGG